jgi:hypothetical protein
VTGVVFHSRKALNTAAEELLVSGVNRADIDVSASADEMDRRLNYQSIPPAELAVYRTRRDNLSLVPKSPPAASPGAIATIAVAAYLVVRDTEPGPDRGHPGSAVLRVRRRLYRERTLGMDKQSEWQGLLVWVRVRSPDKEARAQEILMRHGGNAVHVHEIELANRTEDLPLRSLRPDPWLAGERLGQP